MFPSSDAMRIKTDNVVFLVEEQPNPSTDFFVLPAFQAGGYRVVKCGKADLPAPADLIDAIVLFVRYVPTAWLRLVEAVRPQLRRLVFFMDDDVLDGHVSKGLPLGYRFKLARFGAWRKSWLQQQRAELWVSTPFLQKKYIAWQPRLVLPSPLLGFKDIRRVFYHGSSSHAEEISWLRPVMDKVLRRDERLAFEIVGGFDVYRLYRGVPRVHIVQPMKWPAYQAFLSTPGRHIGLAPLLSSSFNRARSYTKFFDITRCGAVGIYTPNSLCAEVVNHGVDGLIVRQDQDAWADAILHIAEDDLFRHSMLQEAQAKQVELADRAKCIYSDLLATS